MKKKKEKSLKLQPKKFALSAGIIMAAAAFLTTLVATIPNFTKTAFIISALYGSVGYTISILGAFIGAAYSFIDTFILAFIFAWLYNKLI